ncbi:MAG: glycine cleavage system protein GcvH [Deltaproteobacteria bacterium]|nr:MAG: glycine cleavage system protein GcvH [Deltaproteobacteria bacterium]
MKEISELNLPRNVLYTKDHEWMDATGNTIRIGINDYAQDQLGEIVYVELPQAGVRLNKGDVFGTVESVKAVSEVFMPVGGEVIKINSSLADAPELVNSSSYDKGWMIEITLADPDEIKSLLDQETYLKYREGIR